MATIHPLNARRHPDDQSQSQDELGRRLMGQARDLVDFITSLGCGGATVTTFRTFEQALIPRSSTSPARPSPCS